MAVAKVCGIETEYGIIVRGDANSNPIAASSTLVNAYVQGLGSEVGRPRSTGWDFEDEHPDIDARGNVTRATYAPEVEVHLVNAVLTNGSRYYVDHAHPELSTPECLTARQALLYDRAGEEILLASMAAAPQWLEAGHEIVVYKNNSDGKGQSYGCHENYLISRSLPFGTLARHATTHLVTRSIFCGAGKVGAESPHGPVTPATFQITQRADFFEEEVGLETTLKRPIINTRDEPHADPKKYRRLHVIIGDANMSEVATFLKLGTTALWLAAVEDDAAGEPIRFANPVQTFRDISRDLSLEMPIELDNGKRMTALEIQWELLGRCARYGETHGLDAVGEEEGHLILDRWELVLNGLESDPAGLAEQIDWIAKYRLIEGYRDRHQLNWNDAKLKAMDLQYHDLRPERSLARRVGLETLCSEEDVRAAIVEPPPDTRAWFRGACLQRFGDQVDAANWDSLVFDVGGDSLQRVPMLEPTKGTRSQLGHLFVDCDSAAELLKRLNS